MHGPSKTTTTTTSRPAPPAARHRPMLTIAALALAWAVGLVHLALRTHDARMTMEASATDMRIATDLTSSDPLERIEERRRDRLPRQ